MMIIAAGKTKKIIRGPQEGTVLLETYDVLTGGDAAKREEITGIGINKTAQAAHVFTLLNAQHIPTAFIRQYAPNTLLCDECEMIPLEMVVRRYAWGSYLIRNPELKTETHAPHRFDQPVCEFFHKWAVISAPLSAAPYQLPEEEVRDKYLRDGRWALGVYTDPYISIQENLWHLLPQKQKPTAENILMSVEPLFTPAEMTKITQSIILPTFLILEKAWHNIETKYGAVQLADLKLELGRRKRDGKIVVADVIDNDSWRIWPGGDPRKQLDKQCFRDNDPLTKVAENYQMVTELTRCFAVHPN